MSQSLRGLLLGLAALVALAFVFGPVWITVRLNPTVRPQVPPPGGRASPEARAAQALIDSTAVVDLHSDALLWDRDLIERSRRGHVDLPRLIQGRVAVQMFTTVTQVPRGMNVESNDDDTDLITGLALLQLWPPRTWTSPLARALHQADKLRGFAARSRGRLSIVTTADELESFLRARHPEEATVAALLGIEGAQALEGDPANVDRLHAAGFRMIGLTHFFDTDVGGSAHGRVKGGLTPMGRDVLGRAAELGIMVDLAHASAALIRDVTRATTRPVVVSHTGVAGTCPSPRNLSDDQLRAVAGTGGVIGIGLWPEALCGETPGDWARAVRHATDVVGVDHVALGSDWDGAVRAIVDASGTARLAEALLAAGFTDGEIRAILGENTLRVLRETLPRTEPRGGARRRGNPDDPRSEP